MLNLHTTDDGRSQTQLRTKSQTVWLSQRKLAQVFDTNSDNVGLDSKKVLEDGELRCKTTTEESSVVHSEGEAGRRFAGTHVLQPRRHPRRRLPSALAARLAVPPLASTCSLRS